MMICCKYILETLVSLEKIIYNTVLKFFQWIDFITFSNIFISFIVIYLLGCIVLHFKKEIREDYNFKNYIKKILIIGLCFDGIYAFFEQFDFGPKHKYYRAGAFAISIVYAINKVKFTEYEKASEEFIASEEKDLDSQLDNKIFSKAEELRKLFESDEKNE